MEETYSRAGLMTGLDTNLECLPLFSPCYVLSMEKPYIDMVVCMSCMHSFLCM